jgi:hypothetical protein
MSFDLYGLFDQAALESGQVVDPDNPLAPMRQPGGFNLAQAGKRTMLDRQNLDRQQAIQERAQAQQANRRIQQGGFATGNPMFNPMAVAQHAGMMGAQQANSLQNAINQTSNAWRDEHDSRVSQNREARRMEHEKDIERMRIEALLKRLEMEKDQGPRPLASGPGFTIR